MKLDAFKSKEEKVQSTEKKELDFGKMVLYPSNARQTKIHLAFLKWDYDLTPENKGNDVLITHNLVKPFKGRYKAISNKKLNRYEAKEDQRGADGKVHTKAGQMNSYFDKDHDKNGRDIKPCILEKEMVRSKAKGEDQFRRSVELYMLAYVFNIESVDENGNDANIEVNDYTYVGIPVMDLYQNNGRGFGKKLMSSYSDDPKKNKLATKKFIYSADGLDADENLSSDELKIVEPLRKKANELLKEDKFVNKMNPATYEEIYEAIEFGEYSLLTGDVVKESVKSKDVEYDEDTPPF